MDDENIQSGASEEQKQKDQEVIDLQKKERDLIRRKLEERGHKQVSFSDYENKIAKKTKKKPFKIPKALKTAFKIFILILTFAGILVLIYTIYTIATGEYSYTQSELEEGFSYTEQKKLKSLKKSK